MLEGVEIFDRLRSNTTNKSGVISWTVVPWDVEVKQFNIEGTLSTYNKTKFITNSHSIRIKTTFLSLTNTTTNIILFKTYVIIWFHITCCISKHITMLLFIILVVYIMEKITKIQKFYSRTYIKMDDFYMFVFITSLFQVWTVCSICKCCKIVFSNSRHVHGLPQSEQCCSDSTLNLFLKINNVLFIIYMNLFTTQFIFKHFYNWSINQI